MLVQRKKIAFNLSNILSLFRDTSFTFIKVNNTQRHFDTTCFLVVINFFYSTSQTCSLDFGINRTQNPMQVVRRNCKIVPHIYFSFESKQRLIVQQTSVLTARPSGHLLQYLHRCLSWSIAQ